MEKGNSKKQGNTYEPRLIKCSTTIIYSLVILSLVLLLVAQHYCTQRDEYHRLVVHTDNCYQHLVQEINSGGWLDVKGCEVIARYGSDPRFLP